MNDQFDFSTVGMGWHRDLPDFRDYTPESPDAPDRARAVDQGESVKAMLGRLKLDTEEPAGAPPTVDLRPFCSPIEDQGALGSCTANAGVGIVEYFERRAFGRHIDASRLFLYKVTRNLLKWHGDTGAYLRTTMGGMALFGVPPESYWPYVIADFDKEPAAFCYAFAQNYQAIQYFRLDPPGINPNALLQRIKIYLKAGLPSMFGFTVYGSITQASDDGDIPYPSGRDRVAGGHAIVAVGYDDKRKIKNEPHGPTTTGALLIRNSWGTRWGDRGYGWLPYDYVTNRLAVDWWVLLRNEWVNTGNFGL
jgi:C1A family cysteine protease